MAHFISETPHHGIHAVVTLGDYQRIKDGEKLEYGIFLFADAGLLDWPIHLQPWFHGNHELMEQLLTGHFLEYGSFGGVPFSNGASLYDNRESLLNEITRIAPMHKLLEAFGVELVPQPVPAA